MPDGSFGRGNYCKSNGGTGWSTWTPNEEGGQAHCCKPVYHNPGYGVLNQAEYFDDNGKGNNLHAATTYCAKTDFPHVCTVRQVREIELNRFHYVKDVSSIYADGSFGWYNGVATEGKAKGQQRWDSLTAQWSGPSYGVHCCSAAAYKPTSTYGIIPEDEQYGSSTFYSGDDADRFCKLNGWDGLCTVGQQATANKCKVGYAFTNEAA